MSINPMRTRLLSACLGIFFSSITGFAQIDSWQYPRLNAGDAVSLDLFPAACTAVTPWVTPEEALINLQPLFGVGAHLERASIYQSRDSGNVSADTFRGTYGLGVESTGEREIKFSARHHITSRAYDVNASGQRLPPPRSNDRYYDNVYKVSLDSAEGSTFLTGSMTTENDSAGAEGTRGKSLGRLINCADGSIVWDAVPESYALYRVAGGQRLPGRSLTRTVWNKTAEGKIQRTTMSATYEVALPGLLTTGRILEEFYGLVSQEDLSLVPPSAIKWEIVTDGAARGGPTVAHMVDSLPGVVNFEGVLGSIPGRSGPVGFALTRLPLVLGAENQSFFFSLETATPITIDLVFKTSAGNGSNTEGDLTYQTSVPLRPGKQIIRADFNTLVPTIRGRTVPSDQAPRFLPENVVSVAIQVSRSRQPDPSASPSLPFSISIRSDN